MDTALIIFVKNPVYGKVKTRLAATLGPVKALAIYKDLLAYTHQLTRLLPYNKYVYYTDYIAHNDLWQHDFYKRQQQGIHLGSRMMHAFTEVFSKGHKRVLIIGSDCMELTPAIIAQAFLALEKNDVVIGPAADGGYYLLALNTMHKRLFENIPWSTGEVLHQTLAGCRTMGLHYHLLPQLNDIDEEADWLRHQQQINRQ